MLGLVRVLSCIFFIWKLCLKSMGSFKKFVFKVVLVVMLVFLNLKVIFFCMNCNLGWIVKCLFNGMFKGIVRFKLLV